MAVVNNTNNFNNKILILVAFLLFLIAAIIVGFAVGTVPGLALVAGGLAAYMLAKLF